MSGHEETFVKVNARVDSGIAPLIAALNEFPGLCTVDSCEGGAWVRFRFGTALDESAAFLCWLSCKLVGEQAHISGDWGGGASLDLYLRCPPSEIDKIADLIRLAAKTFRSSVCLCGRQRTESRNSTNRRAMKELTGPSYDLPANLVDRIVHDLQN